MRFWDGGKTEDPVVGSRSRWDFSRRNMVVELGCNRDRNIHVIHGI
jgi:hypothetical protein